MKNNRAQKNVYRKLNVQTPKRCSMWKTERKIKYSWVEITCVRRTDFDPQYWYQQQQQQQQLINIDYELGKQMSFFSSSKTGF